MTSATVTVQTVNLVQGEKSSFKTRCSGTYFYKNGMAIVQYTDVLYGDVEQEIKTSVKIFNNTVTLTRNGEAQSRIVITAGQRQACVYETPYGSFVFGFTGEKLRHRFTEQGGELFVRYRVDTEKQPLQTNEITLKVRKCEP